MIGKKFLTRTMMTVGVGALVCLAPNLVEVKAAAPSNLVQVGGNSEKVVLEGSGMTSDDKITVQKSMDNGVTWETAQSYWDNQNGQLKISNLKSGKHILVKVANQDGESSPLEVVTAFHGSNTTIKQEADELTTKKVKVSWKPVEGADGYALYVGDQEVQNVTGTACTINKGLKTRDCTNIKIYPYTKTDTYCALAEGSIASTAVYLRPGKQKIKFTNLYTGTKTASIYGKIPLDYAAFGAEIKLYNGKGKKFQTIKHSYNLHYAGGDVTFSSDKAPANHVYGVKVRLYVTIDGKKQYGAWSDMVYGVPTPSVNVKKVKVRKENALKVTWRKISGATGYDIYAAPNNKSKKSFKKIASVSAGTKSYTIKKLSGKKIAKKKTYYVYVVAKKKAGNKVWKSANR